MQGAELDEILKRLALHEGVLGTIVVNGEGDFYRDFYRDFYLEKSVIYPFLQNSEKVIFRAVIGLLISYNKTAPKKVDLPIT